MDSFREERGEGLKLMEVLKTQREFDNPVGMVVWHNSRLVHFHQVQLPGSGHHKDLVCGLELDGRIDGQALCVPGCGLGCGHLHRTASSLLRQWHPSFVTGADV